MAKNRNVSIKLVIRSGKEVITIEAKGKMKSSSSLTSFEGIEGKNLTKIIGAAHKSGTQKQ